MMAGANSPVTHQGISAAGVIPHHVLSPYPDQVRQLSTPERRRTAPPGSTTGGGNSKTPSAAAPESPGASECGTTPGSRGKWRTSTPFPLPSSPQTTGTPSGPADPRYNLSSYTRSS